jgi:hypothetical protein
MEEEGVVMIYAVMRETIRAPRGRHYQDDDGENAKTPIDLYSTLKDANTRVRFEYENWNGKVSRHEEFGFDFTSWGSHYWEMMDTREIDSVRVYVEKRLIKGPDSEPVRIWKRPLPGEDLDEEYRPTI